MNKKEKLIKKIINLPITERAEIIDVLLKTLDQPDESIDNLWKEEVENRIDAYQEGKISSLSDEEAIAKYQNR